MNLCHTSLINSDILKIFLSQYVKRIVSKSLMNLISGYKEESSTNISYKTSKSTRPPINKELDKDNDTNKGNYIYYITKIPKLTMTVLYSRTYL